jgi:hypothetical protein
LSIQSIFKAKSIYEKENEAFKDKQGSEKGAEMEKAKFVAPSEEN